MLSHLKLSLGSLAIVSLFCWLLSPALYYSINITAINLLLSVFTQFQYLLLPGESQLYVIKIGSSPEYHTCNATFLYNSSTWMSALQTQCGWNQSHHLSFLRLSTTKNWSGLPLGNIFCLPLTFIACIFKLIYSTY